MRPASRHRHAIHRALAQGRVLVVLDFDGTLAPIVSSPGGAHIAPHTVAALHALADCRRARVAVISGRPLSDLQKRFHDRRFFYGGNHGLEMCGPGWTFRHPMAHTLRPTLRRVAKRAELLLSNITGAIVENKGLSLSFHYRGVPSAKRSAFHRAIRLLEAEFQSLPIRWRRGKMVREALPQVDWHKGRAAEELVRRLSPLATVTIGDDITDEDMFRALGRLGPTLRVGRRRSSCASYFLSRQSDVAPFLHKLSKLLA